MESNNNEIKNQEKCDSKFLTIYNTFKDYFHRNVVIELDADKGLMQYLQQESIFTDNDSLSIISHQTKKIIKDAIDTYGSVFPKINFSAPTDSYFLVQDLRCFNLDEVLVLLKGSPKLYDNYKFEEPDLKIFLTLKKWFKVQPQNEFRLFFARNGLKGICQRHLNYCFGFISDDLEELKISVQKFIENEKIIGKLKSIGNEDLFVMDIVRVKGKIKIVDVITDEELKSAMYAEIDYINYFLLFTEGWKELIELKEMQFRIIKTYEEIVENEENLNRFPQEIIGSENRENIEKIIDMMKESEK
jgi:hypothetical protein